MPQYRHAESNCEIPAARAADSQASRPPSEFTQNVSGAHQGVIPTRAGLQLMVKAGCANLEIFADAANQVSYSLHLDPKVARADADAIPRDFSLTAHNTPRGVVLVAQGGRGSDCRANVTYEIHVPRRYALEIAVQSGDIVAHDIDGVVAFFTGGGNIRAERVGPNDPAGKAQAVEAFIAQLETAGGDISIGDVAGGLRARTAGGRIAAGDVHGPAVLHTGGGDIHVGHVFGAARFTSGGGNIAVERVDGGVWADTAGGRVEIGSTARMAGAGFQFAVGERDALPIAAMRPGSGTEQGMPDVRGFADIIEFARLFDALLWGAIRIDPTDQQKRLAIAVAPEYPDVARLAGIDGDVTLRVFIGQDGTIRGITPVSGPPVLARAAMHAVERWRYLPALIDGHPVNVVTSVTLAFRLHP